MMQPWMKRPSMMVEKYQPSFSNIFPVSWTEQVIIINEYYRGHSCGNPASLTTKFEGRQVSLCIAHHLTLFGLLCWHFLPAEPL